MDIVTPEDAERLGMPLTQEQLRDLGEGLPAHLDINPCTGKRTLYIRVQDVPILFSCPKCARYESVLKQIARDKTTLADVLARDVLKEFGVES